MPTESKTYCQNRREAISAGMSAAFIDQVIEGTYKVKTLADRERLRTCIWAQDKVVPSPPQSVITHESDSPPDFNVFIQAD